MSRPPADDAAKPQPTGPVAPEPPDLDESVAGEEDPGASLDLAVGTPPAAPSPGDGPKPRGSG